VAPVISSLAGALRRYVMSVLPTEYVRDYFIDTELPIVRFQQRRKFRPMMHSQLDIRKLPLLSIKVDSTADPSPFATGTTFWTSTRFLDDPTRLARLIVDDDNLRYVGYETERMVMRFQVSFTVETDLKAAELMMYLRRSLPIDQKVYLNDVDVATEVPMDVLRPIWTDMGLGDGTDPDDVAEFREYLTASTAGLVEQVTSSSTGRLVFAFHYRANPIVNITSVPSMTPIRDGNVVTKAQVDIPFEMDVMVPVAYALRQEQSLGSVTPINPTPFDIGDEGAGAYYSAQHRTRPPQTVADNLTLVYFTAVVTADVDPARPGAPDVTDLSTSVDGRMRAYIHALLSGGAQDKVEAKLWLDGDEIGAGWEFDPATWALTIDKVAFQPRQKYHFGLYTDLSRLDELAPVVRRPQAPSPTFKRINTV
jgi:hypothetical protein